MIQTDNKIAPKLRQIPVNLWKIEKTAVKTLLCIERCGDKGRFKDILYCKTETLYLISIFFLQKFKKNHEFQELTDNFINVHKSVDRLYFTNSFTLKSDRNSLKLPSKSWIYFLLIVISNESDCNSLSLLRRNA